MTRAHKLNIVGKTAIVAALLGGSSLSLAQDAAPTMSAPAQPVPIEAPTATPAVVPPPAVSTLPGPNDTVNPVAAQEAEAEAAAKRQATVAPKAEAKRAAPVAASVAPTAAIAPDPVNIPLVNVAPSATDVIDPPSVTINEAAPVTTVDDVAAQDAGMSDEDLTLVGGLAAALAAIGLGAAFASRRRRRTVANDDAATPLVQAGFAAPRPIKEDPLFRQFAVAPAPAAERPVRRASVMTRPDVPITDPLFSTPIMAGPITDPLFAPRNDVQPPITDPLFAKHDRFVGRAPATPITTRESELVN